MAVINAEIKVVACSGTECPTSAIVANVVKSAIAGTNKPTPLQEIKNIIASSKLVSIISVASSLNRCIQNSFWVDSLVDGERQR